MFGSAVLEIAIGMLFIYFLLSTMCSAVSEWIGAMTASRSRSLQAGIRSLLNDPDGRALAGDVLDHPLIRALKPPGKVSLPGLLALRWERFKQPQYLSSELFVTALLDRIAPMGKDSPARSFADLWNNLHDQLKDHNDRKESLQKEADELKKEAALLKGDAKKQKEKEADAKQTAAQQADSSAETWKALLAIAGTAPNDLDAARKKLADWYDEGMERVSGWYKRKSQLMLTFIAAVFSLVINADGVNFLQFLNQDSAVREAISAAARDFVQTPAEAPRSTTPAAGDPKKTATAGTTDPAADQMGESERHLRSLATQLRSYSLPIGWDLTDFRWGDFWASFTRDQSPAKAISAPADGKPTAPASARLDFVTAMRRLPATRRDWMFKALGLLFSTVAMSMGATFYFDLLKQLVNVRSTGIPPDEITKPQPKTS